MSRPQPDNSLYARLKQAGCKLDSHESDLYVLATPEARAIVTEYEAEGGLTNKQEFRSDIDGKIWLDLPFHNQPWWTARFGNFLDEEAAPAPGM